MLKKSLTIGRVYFDLLPMLDIKELAKLIKICKNENVHSLKYEGIEILMYAPDQPYIQTRRPARASMKKAKSIEDHTSLQEQYDDATEALDTLFLEDPSLAEQLLVRGELEKEENRRSE